MLPSDVPNHMYTRNHVCLYENMCIHSIDMDLGIYHNMIFTTERTGMPTLNDPNKTVFEQGFSILCPWTST